MAVVSSRFVHQGLIAGGVARATRALAPEVVYNRYNIGEDWSGKDAVFFRVLLSDAASRRDHLRELSRRVSPLIECEVQPWTLGLQAYFNFRSESEQTQLNEEAWI